MLLGFITLEGAMQALVVGVWCMLITCVVAVYAWMFVTIWAECRRFRRICKKGGDDGGC